MAQLDDKEEFLLKLKDKRYKELIDKLGQMLKVISELKLDTNVTNEIPAPVVNVQPEVKVESSTPEVIVNNTIDLTKVEAILTGLKSEGAPASVIAMIGVIENKLTDIINKKPVSYKHEVERDAEGFIKTIVSKPI